MIQKTLIKKYINLLEQELVTEAQLLEFSAIIEHFYRNKILHNGDIYRQKIEMIIENLSDHIQILKRKRTKKELELEENEDFYKILKNDVEGFEIILNLQELCQVEKTEEKILISTNNIKAILENLIILKKHTTTENSLEKFISNQLEIIFGKEKVHRQYSVGGFLALKTDIDIGNGQVGIELKLVDNLDAVDMQRLIGQVLYYKKRFYKNNNLIVFMVSKSTMNAKTKELIDFIEGIEITVIFASVCF